MLMLILAIVTTLICGLWAVKAVSYGFQDLLIHAEKESNAEFSTRILSIFIALVMLVTPIFTTWIFYARLP